MKLLTILAFLSAIFFASFTPALAAGNSEVSSFTNQTLNVLFVVASLFATLFLIKGGYEYITSSGKPDSIEHAKLTIRNAFLGLILVLGAAVISSVLNNSFSTPSSSFTQTQINLKPIEPTTPSNGLTQVLLDAIAGFMQNIVQSATKPITDGIISFLTTTPQLTSNSVIFNFWLIILGITDALFALVIALLGFQLMSASTFGFEEMEFKKLLPRIGLAFIGANTSIFLADWIVGVCNVLVSALLHATGGIANAWVLTAFNPALLTSSTATILTLIFMLLFVILSVVLLLFYVSRLIIIALGAVLSPLIFLLWITPKFNDFAEISIKGYLVTVFSVFVHLVIIQLASAFLAVPGQQGTNSLISILVGIGLLFTLLKTPSIMMEFIYFNSGRSILRNVGRQLINVISTSKASTSTASGPVKTPRKVVAA